MRIFIFLLCTTVFSLTTENGLAQKKVTIDQDKILTVDEVFDVIANQTKYNFIYPENLFKNAPKVKLQKGNISVGRLLHITLPKGKYNAILGTEDRITIKEKNQSQKIEVSGIVKDQNGLPLPGVTVAIKGTNKGLSTNFEGKYQITVPDAASVLAFSYIGFQTQEIIVGEQTEINITLKVDVSSLEEVVLVGYGSTKKKDLTGSVGTVKAVEISQIKTQTIDQALVGKIPGVYINALSGAPGAGAIVHIRGLSALRGDNQPLYVVDGVPIIVNPVFEDSGIGIFGSRENPLLAINPDDVERVDVLKDASAAGIYGSRAANGVILITTKRGSRNKKPQFTFSLNSTISNPVKKWDALNVEQYKTFVTEGAQIRINAGSGSSTDETIVNTPNQFFGNANTDWQDEVTNNNALWNDYRFGLSGGTEDLNYLISAGVTDQEGIMIGSGLDRYSLSANIDADVTKRIKTGVSFNYNYSVNKSSGVTGLQQGLEFRPDIGVYDEKGQYTGVPALGGAFGPDVLSRNPVGGSGLATNKSIGQYLYGSVYGEYKIMEGLKFRSQINISVSNDRASNFSPSFTDEALFGLYRNPEAEATLEKQRTDAFTTVFNNTLNYSKYFGDHKIDAVAGVSWDHNRTDIEAQTYAGFPDDFILVDPRSANRISSYGSESIEGGLNSLFGRVNYNFDDRYLATFTIRRDGSTKFGPNNQYGTFPSGALAWNLHNEDFFNIDEVNQLKLRASLGKTGNDNLAAFSYLAYMSSLPNSYSVYADVNGIAITGLPNPNIRWESTNQLDLGLEFGLFNNRLNGEIVYFEKNTTGMIIYSLLPSETGFASFNANVADVSNKGWELSIGGDIIRNTDFNWNSSFNISFIKGVVENLYGGSVFSTGNTNIAEGEPIGIMSGYVQEAIAQDTNQIDALNAGAPDGNYYSGLREPGDYIYQDVNGDGEITSEDRVILGDINPDYFGGWNNSLSYKNFDASFNIQFAQGHSRDVSNTLVPKLSNSDPYANTTTIIYDTWTPDNRDATYARIGASSETYSSTYVSDASYIRLRSASIGYNFNNQWLNDFGIDRARFNLSGNNLFTITDYVGLDPESVSNPRGGQTTDLIRDEGYAYPVARTFTLGLTISF